MAVKEQMGPYFISFASADHAVAAELTAKLGARNIATFFAPRDISAGENFAVRIVQGIVDCNTVIVLLSASAIASPHVRREVSLAIDERRQVIPVALPGIRFPQDFTPEWSYWLSAVQVFDFTTIDHLLGILTTVSAVSTGGAPSKPLAIPSLAPVPKPEFIEPVSPVSLLRPERAVVPFAGREDDLARLVSWLDRSEKTGVRLLTARGGQGKSRLAQELVSKAANLGWDAAFVRDIAALVSSPSVPTLRVIDYAETKGPELAEAIGQLSLDRRSTPFRLLLLARSAGDWWRALGNANTEVEDLLADAVVQELAPLTGDPGAAAELYRMAVASFAKALGVTVPDLGPPLDLGDSAVDLMQRALLAVLADAQTGDPERVVGRLLGHERRYVRVAAATAGLQHFDDVDFDRATALFSLFPPRDEAQAVELAGIAQPGADFHDHRRLARLLRRVYPSPDGYSGGLKPDAVAELAVAGLLAEDGAIPGGVHTWSIIDDERFESGLRVLARAAGTAPHARAELHKVVGESGVPRLRMAMDVAIQVESPDAIASAIRTAVVSGRFDGDLQSAFELLPEETVALSEVGAVLTDRIINGTAVGSGGHVTGGLRLLEASNRFSDAGWNNEALSAVSAGVAELRQDRSEPAQLELGRALSNLSNRLWETGALEAALSPAAEAVDLLASRDDRLALLGARNNLAFRLIEAGHYDDALVQCELALELVGSDGHGSGRTRLFALSVDNNLLCLDAAMASWGSAAERATKLIEQRRNDYSANRDRHLAYLARALANAAIPYAAAGETKAALRAIAEARSLHLLTALRAPIFAFEAAESALIDAVVRGLANSAGSEEALDDARGTLAGLGPDLVGLSKRLGGAIIAVGECLAAGTALRRDSLAAVGAAAGPATRFPLLLEYKDL